MQFAEGAPGKSRWALPALSEILAFVLVFGLMLSSTFFIPLARPFITEVHHGPKAAIHAFMSLNMLGAIFGAPLVAAIAERTGRRSLTLFIATCIDALLLALLAVDMPLALLLFLRTIQGAANVGALSLLLGSISSDNRTLGAKVGLGGTAIVSAIALGAPVGTLLLRVGARNAVLIAAGVQLLVAFGTRAVRHERTRRPGSSPFLLIRTSPRLVAPVVWITVERFVIGTFVVTFALYGHDVLGQSDAGVGKLFSCFLLPFAVATFVAGALADRINRALLVSIGMVVYSASFLVLGDVSRDLLPFVLAIGGIGSAAIYAPSLCLVAKFSPTTMRSTSMSLANASGSLGMMAGTMLAGALYGVLVSLGVESVYAVIFRVAACAQLITLIASGRSLRRLSKADVNLQTRGIAL